MYQYLEYSLDAKVFIRLQLAVATSLGRGTMPIALRNGPGVRLLTAISDDLRFITFWPIAEHPLPSPTQARDWEYRDKEQEAILHFLKGEKGRGIIVCLNTLSPGFEKQSDNGFGQTYLPRTYVHSSEGKALVGTEAYWVLPGLIPEAEIHRMMTHMRGSFRLCGVLGSFSNPLSHLDENGELTQATLDDIAVRTEWILMAAYDRDAMLIWSRTTAPA